jgi:hypothetical protein
MGEGLRPAGLQILTRYMNSRINQRYDALQLVCWWVVRYSEVIRKSSSFRLDGMRRSTPIAER